MPNTAKSQEERPAKLDDDVEDGWEVMIPRDKLEYLYRSHRETVKQSIDSTRRIEDAMAAMLAEVQDTNSSVRSLQGMVGNQAKVIADQFRDVYRRLDGIERSVGVEAESFGVVAKELAEIQRKLDDERKARERQDSLHEEEITGVGHKAVVAVQKAEEASEKAAKAETAVSKALAQVNLTNVSKGVFLGVVAAIIEALAKNADHVLKLF